MANTKTKPRRLSRPRASAKQPREVDELESGALDRLNQLMRARDRTERIRSSGPFLFDGDRVATKTIERSRRQPQEENFNKLLEARRWRLIEVLEFAGEKLRPRLEDRRIRRKMASGRSAMRRIKPGRHQVRVEIHYLGWQPIRYELAAWLNHEYQSASARLKMAECSEPVTWRRLLARSEREEQASRKLRGGIDRSDVELAVELRDLVWHALQVRDPDHIAWIDLWVDRWMRLVAGDRYVSGKLRRIRQLGGKKVARERRELNDKEFVQHARAEYARRVLSGGERSPEVIADLARKYEVSNKYARDTLKPRALKALWKSLAPPSFPEM